MEMVILVNENDEETGLMEKLQAHQLGLLHRAVSVFIFNSKDQMLIHKRAAGKYHSAGLWTNATCSHPRKGESTKSAAERRLKEEMGINCSLEKKFTFIYKAVLNNNLTEHELDHVYSGYFEGTPILNPEEVESFKWITLEELKKETTQHPEKFTEWFKIILKSYTLNLYPTPRTD
jgi:isopentenyl-diphosphate delta-isomerase